MCVIKCWIYGLTNEKIIIPAYSYPPPPKQFFFLKSMHCLISHTTKNIVIKCLPLENFERAPSFKTLRYKFKCMVSVYEINVIFFLVFVPQK